MLYYRTRNDCDSVNCEWVLYSGPHISYTPVVAQRPTILTSPAALALSQDIIRVAQTVTRFVEGSLGCKKNYFF
jgi:hypothetical protein